MKASRCTRVVLALVAGCSCRDVCKPPYEDAVEECEWRYDPSRDWVGNRDCKAYAKRSYDACLDACRYPDFSGDCDHGSDVSCTP